MSDEAAVNTFAHLPCLRCGERAVLVNFLFAIEMRAQVDCHDRRCGAKHYLSLKPDAGGYVARYNRYTLRYGLDHYDESEEPVVVVDRHREPADDDDEREADYSGPIRVYPRRTDFTGVGGHFDPRKPGPEAGGEVRRFVAVG